MSKNSPFNYSSNPDIAAIEAEIATKAPINNPVFTGTVTLPGNPSADNQAATKAYVDAGLQGLSPKPAPTVATTTSLPAFTYNNGSSGIGATITMNSVGIVAVDGRNLLLNDLVLVKDEGSGSSPYNGLYNVTTQGTAGVALVMTRNTSMDISTEFAGAYLLVNSGSVNSGAGYWCTNVSPPTVGTTNIVFAQFNVASSISAGTGLQKIGSTLSIDSTVATLTGSQALTNKTINGLTPTALATGFTIAGGTTSKTLTVPLDASVSGTNTGDQTSVSGNAGTATALQNARTIGGVSFDGTANIVPQTIQTVDESSDTTCFPLFANSSGTQASGQQPKTNSSLTYNSSTNTLGATTFAGALSGNASTASSAATLTTARAIYGNNFDGSAALTQIIASTYGGTGNGFTKFSGPASSEKTFTLPNASATILTDNALVTAAQGGTNNGFTQFSGPASTTKTFTLPNASANILTDNAAVTVSQGGTGVTSLTAYSVICGGTTSTGAVQSVASVGTAGQALISNGAGALPSFQNLAMVFISSSTASNSASIAFTGLSSSYSYYMVVATEVLAQTGGNSGFDCQISQDNGSTYLSSGYVGYGYLVGSGVGLRGLSNQTTDRFRSTEVVGNTTAKALTSVFYFFNPSNTTNNKMFQSRTNYSDNGSNFLLAEAGSTFNGNNNAYNAVKFFFASGNIVSGTFRLYGVI